MQTVRSTTSTSRTLFRAPSVQAERVFVIGDTHGCLKTFKALLSVLKFGKKDVAYLLGDYIDRGPRIRKLVDFVRKYQNSGNFIPLRGNHEQYLLDAVTDPKFCKVWITKHGGRETLDSFGVDTIHDLPEDYLDWLNALPFVAKVRVGKQDFILSHAGVNHSARKPFANTLINRTYVLYNRDDHAAHHKIRNVVGHSVKTLNEISKSVNGQGTIYIDGGCVSGKFLVALNLSSMDTTAVKCID